MLFKAKVKRGTTKGSGKSIGAAAGSVCGARHRRVVSVRRYAEPEMSDMEKLQATFNTPLEDELYVPVR